jgi:hypothetical protein
MTSQQWQARAEAYLEAAEHLDQCWTEDAIEKKQGFIVGKMLRSKADQCEAKSEIKKSQEVLEYCREKGIL